MTIFNSRDENYKSPFGAVCCGAAVSFTVTPGPEFCACGLLTFGEFAGALYEMQDKRSENSKIYQIVTIRY